MRTLLLSLVLSATAAYGQRVVTPSDDGSGGQCGGRAARTFRAPSGRAGFGKFCDRLLAADKVGNWWCINADGTQPSGSVALTATGTPTVGTPVCAGIAVGNLGGSAEYKTGNVSQPAGTGVTVCAVFKPTSVSVDQILVGHTNVAGSYTFSCDINSGANFTCTARNTTPTASTTGVSTQTAGVLKVFCGSYSTVDGIPRTYGDGMPGTPGSALVPGTLATASVPWHVGGPSTYFVTGDFLGAFMVETQLSASRIAAISTVCQ